MAVADRLDSFFKITERGSTIGTEFRGGTATFLTKSYILLVNAQIMQRAGVSHDQAVLATALSAAASCFIIGIFGNLPFGCAPGLGLSAYIAFSLVEAGLCSLQDALTVCWWSGLAVVVVSLTGVSNMLMKIVPRSIKHAIVVGMGLLIAMIGMVSVGLIVANPKTIVGLGDFWADTSLQLCFAGVVFVASLVYHDVKGAILVGIATLTFLHWVVMASWPSKVFEFPVYQPNDYWAPWVIFDWNKSAVLYPALGSLVLICIFDISGVIFGLSTLGGIINAATGEIPGSVWAFLASGVGTMVAAWLGSTPIIVSVEGASGVREGGRTGLTAVVVGLYFTASVFLAPLFSSVPTIATAPVLVLVGVLMMGEAAKIDWEDMRAALPAFLTIALMPFTFSITNGMFFGLMAAAAFYFTSGQCWKDAKDFRERRAQGRVAELEEALVDAEGGVKDSTGYGSTAETVS